MSLLAPELAAESLVFYGFVDEALDITLDSADYLGDASSLLLAKSKVVNYSYRFA